MDKKNNIIKYFILIKCIFLFTIDISFALSTNELLNRKRKEAEIKELVPNIYKSIVLLTKDSSLNIKDSDILRYSTAIAYSSKKNKINPLLMVSIIYVESEFFHKKSLIEGVSDYSIAQINYHVWSKEYSKIRNSPLNKEKLFKNQIYAINKMGEILKYKKSLYSKEKEWYLSYHSRTKKYRDIYRVKLKKVFDTLIKNGFDLNFI
tara:strand:+ start:3254 stop:3871 length:618 start_codon:yes stop_codon:yes gene_type:complete